MAYIDVDDSPIKQGFYLKTFYKGKDEPNNRIVYITESKETTDMFSVINPANIARLNHNYSRWLKPFEQELPDLEGKLSLLRDADPSCVEGTDLMMDNNGVNDSGLPPVPKLVKIS